ncbi:hypothetical protein AW27_011730 [Streptomyces sp. PCS3-D2]|uniref:hypothetical protein n=1 Tax=Streptomyces sp. PCS3-D2 TaxID=1460244 RepID=UPI00056728F1|nr:hypothetical protein [Streptomyces sp. PCS3-D2]WKV72125.1 hypothetical protein AW27_011730 [Streptomyces sp. PCS3-D2]
MRLRHTITTFLGALALVGTLPASAGAAVGTFSYVSPEYGDFDITDPVGSECFLLLQGATSAVNGTNSTATLYADRGCEEPLSTLDPGAARGFAEPVPHSVSFA